MQPLAFQAIRMGEREVDLKPCDTCEISGEAWDEFADCVAREHNLIFYPGTVFQARLEAGNAAVAVCDGHIVAFTSLMIAFDSSLRMKLAAAWPRLRQKLPGFDVYEFATGWTHPDWRRQHVSLALRRQLLPRFSSPHILCIGVTVGMGAAPVLTRLGWTILPWSRIAYLCSLTAVPPAGRDERGCLEWLMPDGMRLYEGELRAYRPDDGHRWDQFCHFWVADEGLACRLNAGLRTAAGGDLCAWREAIVRTHLAEPVPFWKRALTQGVTSHFARSPVLPETPITHLRALSFYKE